MGILYSKKYLNIFFAAFFLLLQINLNATTQNDVFYNQKTIKPAVVSSRIIPWKLALVSGSVLSVYGVSYFLVFGKSWWGTEPQPFHFENDFEYALNLDKLGHLYSGILMGEFFYDGLIWSGLSHIPARIFAGGFASLTHVGIDIKDGLGPWGYSIWDVIAGSVGGFWPYLKDICPLLEPLKFKATYWKHSQAYWNHQDKTIFTDDYVNWTYWLSFKTEWLFPKSARPYWPDWLYIAAGVSVDDIAVIEDDGINGSREYYVSLDVDLDGIIKPKKYVYNRLLTYITTIKLPTPSIQIYPWENRAIYLMYPLRF